jgi:hypothetical protein
VDGGPGGHSGRDRHAEHPAQVTRPADLLGGGVDAVAAHRGEEHGHDRLLDASEVLVLTHSLDQYVRPFDSMPEQVDEEHTDKDRCHQQHRPHGGGEQRRWFVGGRRGGHEKPGHVRRC